MSTPLTDILCLVHNNRSVTEKFVEHVFANTENFNLIFLDNGSTDSVASFLDEGAQQKRWHLLKSSVNLGVINGRNELAKLVTSEYFVNLDNDQHPQAGWLSKLHDLMSKGYDIVGCEAWSLYPPKTGGTICIDNVQTEDRSYYPFRRCTSLKDKFTYIGCGGMLIKKSVYEQIGLFDERFNPAYFEDPDFTFRCIQAGFKLGWSHDCPVIHLAHQTFNNQTLFGKKDQFLKSWRAFKKKWNPYFPPPMQMK